MAQSLFAIGTGGWFGLGINQGMPYKIPVVEQDFIFSAIAEEMGILFCTPFDFYISEQLLYDSQHCHSVEGLLL